MEFKIANTAYLEELSSGNTELIRQIVELFLEQTPGDIDLLAKHIRDRNWEATYKQAHYLKPTLIYVGAKNLHEQIIHIERLAKSKEGIDVLPDVITGMLPDLEILYDELTEYLRQIA